MTKKDVIKNYNQKIKEYLKHNKLYFEDSNPILSDSDYDLLKIDILNLEKKYNFLNNKNSPSKNVGFYPSKKFEKFKHKVQMLSLSNAFDTDDLINFEKKYLIILIKKFL